MVPCGAAPPSACVRRRLRRCAEPAVDPVAPSPGVTWMFVPRRSRGPGALWHLQVTRVRTSGSAPCSSRARASHPGDGCNAARGCGEIRHIQVTRYAGLARILIGRRPVARPLGQCSRLEALPTERASQPAPASVDRPPRRGRSGRTVLVREQYPTPRTPSRITLAREAVSRFTGASGPTAHRNRPATLGWARSGSLGYTRERPTAVSRTRT